MEKNGRFLKILAVAGTVLVWIPLVAPILLSIPVTVSTGTLRFDYLMPAELSPFSFFGGLMLAVAAFLARSYRKPILWSLIISVIALAGGQIYAVVSGLASGAVAAEGLPWAVVLTLLTIYIAALLVLCLAALRLTRNLFGQH
jgi:hypothetical protein